MNRDEVLEALEQYESELKGILSRFTQSSAGIHINPEDNSRFNEIVLELRDLFADRFKDAQRHIRPLMVYFDESTRTFTGSPSYRGVENIKGLVTAALARVRRNPSALNLSPHNSSPVYFKNPEEIIRIAERLHLVICQLRERYNNRVTLDVKDEYDVQDLIHALLNVSFDDIRKEEWTPSYAGGASRMDFLLPEIESVVETKMVRPSLTTKVLGEQLIVDIAKYSKHPMCRTLYCIVYDPEGRVKNPRGVENDLNGDSPELTVRVMIVPRKS